MSGSTTTSFTTGSTTTTSNSSQYLSTFNFDMLDVSMFDNDFAINAATFDNLLGFEDISPLLVPNYELPPNIPKGDFPVDPTTNNLIAWLDSIPIADPYSKEMRELAASANAP